MRWEIRYREELLELAAVGDFGSVQNVGVRLIDVAGMLSQRPVGGTCLDLQAATGTLTSLAALKLGGAVASLHVSSPIAVLMGNRYFHAAGLLSPLCQHE